jgi:hypothetical protein
MFSAGLLVRKRIKCCWMRMQIKTDPTISVNHEVTMSFTLNAVSNKGTRGSVLVEATCYKP